ncbi:MAG TPA: NAD(P)-binding domain-containing protein, partial [Candidatus Binatia bacterium]|nr:NAD(P)-binding domain-containing protein [Candidatus Binatia bacterium]
IGEETAAVLDVPSTAATAHPPGLASPPPTGPTVAAQQPAAIVLTVDTGPDRGMVFSPNKDVITIGRLSTCDVPLNDPAVSRLHATIKREADGYVLYDEGSRFGIELLPLGKRVFHAPLSPNDCIRIGDSEIRVDIGAGKSAGVASVGDTFVSATVGDKLFSMTLRGLRRRSAVADPGAGETTTREAVGVETIAPSRKQWAETLERIRHPRLTLRIVGGPEAGRTIEAASGVERFTIGRSDDADFQIADAGISGVHLSITLEGGRFVLRDEKSRNGVYLNRRPERVTMATLATGDAITIGGIDLRVEIDVGAAKASPPPADSTVVMPAPGTAPSPPPPPPAPAAAQPQPPPAAAKSPPPKKSVIPELARSREAKERISKMMKGVNLRPVRRPGTPRQWATLALIFLAVASSYLIPRTWVSAGPVHEGHAAIEAKCETCHAPAPRLLSIAAVFGPSRAMNGSCVTADCHAKVLHNKPGVEDDCVSCHVEHRGRAFPIRGGEPLCWSCHRGKQDPPSFDTRLMKIAVTKDAALRAALAPRVHQIETGIKFSHTAHDKETKGDKRFEACVGCHASIDSGRTFAMPSHAQCLECHDKAVSADAKVAQRKKGPDCLQCHTREDGEMAKLPARRFAYVRFAHRDHQQEFCTACHASVWEEGPYKRFTRTADLYPVAMDACYNCHQQKGATVACLDCHREHHSFPAKLQAASVAGRGGLDGWLLAMGLFTLGAAGYVFADMRMARRYQQPAPTPPPAAAAPSGPSVAGEGMAEILPFPKVDVEACISCGSCYGSCPKQVLAGDDHGKSTVVNPGSCIAQEGCAVCEQGCPTGAIRVSTAPLKRSVERPEIDEHNEAGKVPGLFFAGEVVGAALIKSAINQGVDCVKFIADKKPKLADAPYDVIIVGAGPAGLGAALEAKRRNLRYLILERDTVASTIKNYPRDKAVLAEPVKMPLYGQLPMMDAEKDVLIATWSAIVGTTKLTVNEHEEATDVQRQGALLEVTTAKGKYLAPNVVLAIGTRGDPRKLGCAGEAPERVSYNLIDAADFKGKTVLVVGGGDSAIEAAVALAKTEGTKCLLSYRKNAFSRVKKRNQEQIDEMMKSGRIEVLFSSTVEEVRGLTVVVATEAGPREIDAHHVFALIGADPPKGWIEKKLGVPFVVREEEVVTWS